MLLCNNRWKFERFQWTLKQILWKTKLEYHFLVESTKIENATFPYKTALSEANVKTNRMGDTKWICMKERSFATILFFEKFVSFYESFIKSWFDVPTTQMSIFMLSLIAGVLFESAFSLWVSLN